ncbi:hypothetical protein [Desertibaculum subflavum]|uniref:hypothetical protein n=1 Tax=Desertibaculum subflavum TaxID=2268458 RepID=UPI000E66A8B3
MNGDAPSANQAGGSAPEPGAANGRHGRSSGVLLDQFYVTLRAVQRGIDRAALPPVQAGSAAGESIAAIRKDIDALLAQPQSWRSAYEIEQLQCQLMTGGQLDTELGRRLDEAEARKLASVPALKALLAKPEEGTETEQAERKRAVLHRLVNDLQWFYTQRYQRRRTARVLNDRVSLVFLAAFALVITMLLSQLVSLPAKQWTPPRQQPTAQSQPSGGQ